MTHPSSQSPLHDLFVGRQAICNVQLGVYAYELLFRAVPRAAPPDAKRADAATSTVILAAFQDIGIDRLAGSRPVAVNLSPGLLDLASNLPAPPERVILELPLALVRPQTLPALRELKALGYTLALDDFSFSTKLASVYELADMIKIDVRATEAPKLARLPKLLRRLGVRSVAKKVETLDEFEQLRDQGFDLFQGYFLSRPRTLQARKLAANKHALLALLTLLYDPHSETVQIEAALGSDPGLSYKLMRLINSAFFTPPRTINSLHDAIVILGRRRLATWVALTALGRLEDQPPEIFRIALARGRMCERLAEYTGHRGGDGFAVGLFSALHLLLGQSLGKLLRPLPLSEDLKRAILEHRGPLGGLLSTVLAYERNRWRNLARTKFPMDLLRETRLEALEWAGSLSGLVRGG
ncbi:EAL and HDOD domain-containing protein [Acidihalobacter prosperus]